VAKRFFTQGACVLLSRPATLDEVGLLLSEFPIAKRIEQGTTLEMLGPSFTVAFRPEVNGYLTVDVQERPWPDHMGDPQREPTLLGAWSMGFFGPFAFPGNLRRAAQQSWAWKDAKDLPQRHCAFIRVLSSYVLGASGNVAVLPQSYDPLVEMQFLTRVCRALLRHPSALAYFNPNGETLRNDAFLDRSIDRHTKEGLPPLDIWTNVRLFNPSNDWLLMDTVGMEQLDRPDSEACFPKGAYNPREVDQFLRTVALYLMTEGEVIKQADTMDGPGGVRWRALHVEEPLSPPPRRVLRWFPVDGSNPPAEISGS
jgi:hypothetical protein